jgi:predicted amidophosphoribosyltransferase
MGEKIMSEVSCYGCKYDGEKWADECKGCVRMAIKTNIKDKYVFGKECSKESPLYLNHLAYTISQQFDIGLHKTAEWVMPDDLMWHNPTCSNCDFESADHRYYCPNCGAKMVGFLY